MPWRQAGPRTQPFRIVEAVHIADLCHEHRCEHPANAMDCLDCLISRVAFEAGVEPGIDLGDLAVIGLDQTTQRIGAFSKPFCQLEIVEPASTALVHNPIGCNKPSLPSTEWTCDFKPARS